MFTIPPEVIEAVEKIRDNLADQIEQGKKLTGEIQDLTTSINTLTSAIVQIGQILIELDNPASESVE